MPHLIAGLKSNDDSISGLINELITPMVLQVPQAFCYHLLNASAPSSLSSSKSLQLNADSDECDAISLGFRFEENSNHTKVANKNLAQLTELFKSNFQEMAEDLEVFIAEFENVSLTLTEKWHYFLTHLATDLAYFQKSINSMVTELKNALGDESIASAIKGQLVNNSKDTVSSLYKKYNYCICSS